MRKLLVAAGVAAVVVVVVVLWLRKGSSSDTPATPNVPHGSNAQVTTPSKPTPKTPAQLAVTVRDARGPLAGARVRIDPADGEVTVLETKADGTAQATLEPGAYAIAVSAERHQPVAAPRITLDPGETEKVTIELQDGGRALSGVVTDVSGGPIAGARIDAARLGGRARSVDAAVATAITGADGKYRMTVAEGQLLVAARSPDYAAQSRVVDIGEGDATADFALVPGGVIEGIVLDDRSKQPIANASVIARRDSASIMLAEGGARAVTSASDGRFRITGLRPGAYELGARAEGRRTRSPTLVGLGVADQVTDVQLLVGKTPVVRGNVVDEAGAPVANARVVTFEDFGSDDAKTDDQGRFLLDGLAPGPHALIARADTHVATAPNRIELGDQDLDGIVLRMTKAGTLKGHVEPRQPSCEVTLEPDDEGPRGPRPMMMMMANGHSTTQDGTFEIAPATPGKLLLAARCASGDQGKVVIDWTPAIADVTLAVSPGASIAGKVVDGDGKPVAGITVMANGTRGTMRTTIVNGMVTSGVQGITTAAGTYKLEGLAPNTYLVSALDRGRPVRARKPPPSVTLAAGAHETGVDLAIDRANGVIKGVVTGPDGTPLADAWVSVQQDLEAMLEGAMARPGGPGPGPGGPGPGGPSGPGGPGDDDGEPGSRMIMVQASDDDAGGGAAGGYPPVLTDAQGRFEITGLPHLTFDVVAEAQAGKLRGRAEGVKPDATVAIKALGVTSLSGTVRGPTGPAALFTVSLEGPTQTMRSFTDGTFSLGRVDPGSYTVRVSSTEGNGEATVVIAPNTPATVDIVLVANAVVIGTVVDPSGNPVADVPVVVVDDQPEGSLELSLEGPPPTTGPDGKFRIERKAGKGMLVVMAPPRPITKRGLALEAGATINVGTLTLTAPPK